LPYKLLVCTIALRPQSKDNIHDDMMQALGNCSKGHHALHLIAQLESPCHQLLTNAVHYRLRLSWDRVLDPKAKHVQLDKRVRGAQANVDLSHILPSGSALHSDASISAQDSDDDAEMVSILFHLHLHKRLIM